MGDDVGRARASRGVSGGRGGEAAGMTTLSPTAQAAYDATRASFRECPPPPLPPQLVDVIVRVLAPAMRRRP